MIQSKTIRQAEQSDLKVIDQFIKYNHFIHYHADWGNIDEWVDQEFLLMFSDEELIGTLAITSETEHTSWVRLFCTASRYRSEEIWQDLFAEYLQRRKNPNQLYALGSQDWFSDILRKNSFKKHQKIIFFEHQLSQIQPINFPSEISLRNIQTSQLSEIAQLDARCFQPLWQLPGKSLMNAMKKAGYARVAILDGKIIGYQITTESYLSAHLARLAVDPLYRRKGIGKLLLFDLFYDCKRRGIKKITVNTQNDNTASQALYLSSGFEPIDESYPVFLLDYKIEPFK